MATWLKTLLQQQHLQNHELFLAEYDKIAETLGQQGGGPSRSQFLRWLKGDLKRIPHPHHCRVLEEMFPQWTAVELFAQPADESVLAGSSASQSGHTGAARTGSGQRSILRSKAELDGTVVDLHTRIELDINEMGHAYIRYSYKILNLTEKPVNRIPRMLWFKHTHDEIRVEPIQFEPYQSFVQPIHSTPHQNRFAYHLSPAVPPGEVAQYGCECWGGQFLDELYWRHQVMKATELLTISVQHRTRRLRSHTATEELTDGTQILITDAVQWRQEDDGLHLHLESGDLQPTQSVTLRWEIEDE